jgi:hypothetical protein
MEDMRKSQLFLNKLIVLKLYSQYNNFWAKVGHPYMGVGRNLTYKKEEFLT